MPSSYSKITIQSIDETLIAMLSMDFPFESFEENENHTIGYIHTDSLSIEIKSGINILINQFDTSYEWEAIEDQNWNEVWESNFQAVNIDSVCRIRAEFHEPDPSFAFEIVIQPKMAFGTGHHQTTYIMIKSMGGIDFKNKTVYDYGCGTGILAIFASMLGSGPIDAVDIEKESYLNTIENAARNNIKNITAFEGDIHSTPTTTYDIILANINRNILLASTEDLAKKSHANTVLLLSGILTTDVEVITSAFHEVGFAVLDTYEKESWVCMKLKHN